MMIWRCSRLPNVEVKDEKKIWKDWFTDRSREACDQLVRIYLPLVQFHVQRISVGLPGSVRKDELTSHGLSRPFRRA